MIVQPFTFTLPLDLPAGAYQGVLGIYDASNGQRQQTADGDTVRLFEFVLSD